LIREDHSLAVDAIDKADILVTQEEQTGFSYVPTTVNFLRTSAGLLPETLLTVPAEVTSILEAQLRKSTINVRPGHRVAGSIIFGSAGARISFNACSDPEALQSKLLEFFKKTNPFNLKITLRRIEADSENTSFDFILTSSTKDPHSGMNGDVFPCGCVVTESKYSMGNAFETDFKDIWNGDKYIAARKELLDQPNNLETICHLCKANGYYTP